MILIQRNWGKLHGGVAPVWVWEDGQDDAADTQTGNNGNPQKADFQGLLRGRQETKLAASENAKEGQSKELKKTL